MLVNEQFNVNDLSFLRTYSDLSVYIQQVGTPGLYTEAEYPASVSSQYQFIETDRKIEYPEDLSSI